MNERINLIIPGGKVTSFNGQPLNDTGSTREVVWKEQPDKAWQRKEREMTDNARNYYPNPRESALERELWNQVTGDSRSALSVNSRLEQEYAAAQDRLHREDQISGQLMQQVIEAASVERQRLVAESRNARNS